MKKIYIRPETEKISLSSERLMLSNSEEEWGSWIGAKEGGTIFDDVDDDDDSWSNSNKDNSLWEDDEDEASDY